MSIYLKRISLLLLLVVLISGCAKKLPPQLSEGKAFSKQPYVVQGNIQYRIKEYQRGINKNVTPNQEFIKFLVEAKNIGKEKELIKPESVKLINGTEQLSPTNPKSSGLFRANVEPQEKLEDWIIFDVNNKLKPIIYLQINKGKIAVRVR